MAMLLNSPIGNISGSIGGLTFSVRRKKNAICQKRNKKAPSVINVQKSQFHISNYSTAWKGLKFSDKQVWDNLSKQIEYSSGYNLFLHATLCAAAVNDSKFLDVDGLDSYWSSPLHFQDYFTGTLPIDSRCDPIDTNGRPLALEPFMFELSSDYSGAQMTFASVNTSQCFNALRNQQCYFSLIVRFSWTNGARRYVINVGSIIQVIFPDDSPSHDIRIYFTSAMRNFLMSNLPHNTLVKSNFILFNFAGAMRQNNIFTTQFYS